MTGFIIWAAVGLVIVILGICDIFAEKPAGFWANVDTMKVNDIKGYNRSVGMLFIIYGFVFILFGIPLLSTKNNPWILLLAIGVIFETIFAMAYYSIHITNKYKADK